MAAQAAPRDGAARRAARRRSSRSESYLGAARPGKRGRGAEGKAIIAIAVEDHDGVPGTRMLRILDVTRQTLTDFVLDHIARETEVRTDAYHGYNDVGRHRFSHVVINIKASGDPADIAMAHVHRVTSLLTRQPTGPRATTVQRPLRPPRIL